MSSISAGTTVNTGLVYTSDTTGTLQIKTGASAVTAIAIDAAQNVGFGTITPAKKVDAVGTYRAQIDPNNFSLFGATLTLAGDNGTNQSGGRIVGGYEGSFGLLFQTSTAGQAGLSSDPSLLTYTTKAKIDIGGNLQFNSGYGSVATAYGCRAWVNFNGQGTVAIRGQGNVTSITDNAVGDYTVNFTTAMPDVNYAFNGMCTNSGTNIDTVVNQNLTTVPSTSSMRITVIRPGTGVQDVTNVCVSIFR